MLANRDGPNGRRLTNAASKARQDVMTYETAPLKEDLTITGEEPKQIGG